MDYISAKLVNSGFKTDEIRNVKERALQQQLDRNEILSADKSISPNDSNDDKQLTFLIDRDSFICKEIKNYLNSSTLLLLL